MGKIQIFQYVRHEDVPAFISLGWTAHNSLDGCGHGVWSKLMEWQHETAPVFVDGYGDRKHEVSAA